MLDKSAYARMRLPAINAVLEPMILDGEAATCGMIDLEILYSARSAADLRTVRQELSYSLVLIPMDQRDFDRAAEVMELLAERGQHRSARIPDLLIAAVAERAGLIVIHYDEDFDRIASVTGQLARWVTPRGTL